MTMGDEQVTLHHGDCREVMAAMPDASVDAIVTDPPAGIAFMGREWDRDKGGRDAWVAWLTEVMSEALRVAKPGAHALVWALPRTSGWTHRAIEDAGWEVRDCLTHLFGSGFPKSHNLHGGLGTALKPGAEFWYLARKPLIGTVAANVTAHGTGALNIDATRIGYEPGDTRPQWIAKYGNRPGYDPGDGGFAFGRATGGNSSGRWPANVILDEEAGALLDAQSGTLTSGANPTRRAAPKFGTLYGDFEGQQECVPARGKDTGGASRFFYCAKASRSERNAGLEGMPERTNDWQRSSSGLSQGKNPVTGERSGVTMGPRANHHPTVKPIALMRWLVRLITTPGGIVLDLFMGSGSTGCAAVLEGFRFIGIDAEEEYVEIARRRIAHHGRQTVLAIA